MIDDLSTYSLRDFMMFSPEAFLGAVENYNLSIWPLQTLLFGISLLSIYMFFRGRRGHRRLLLLYLAGAWLFQGILFYGEHLSEITWAGHYLVSLSVVQSLLLLGVAASHTLTYANLSDSTRRAGALMLFLASILPIHLLPQTHQTQLTLFPWGPIELPLGTIVAVLFLLRTPFGILTSIIPLLLASGGLFALYG